MLAFVYGWLAVSVASAVALAVIAARTPVEPSIREIAPRRWQIRYRCGQTEIVETEPGQYRLTEAQAHVCKGN